MFHKILVPTDGSEPARRAVGLAGDLARVHGARVVLLHVVNRDDRRPDWLQYADAHALGFAAEGGFAVRPAGPAGRDVTLEDAPAEDVARTTAERLLQECREIAAEHGADSVSVVVEEGEPTERILETAHRENANVIVMGSHGYGPLKELMAGSVSSAVAKNADCPCIAVT